MEKLKIYRPRINAHTFSDNAHPTEQTEDTNDVKIWYSDNQL